jgi:hypothetical protein
MATKKTKKKSSMMNKIVVNRKFLNDLADRIYNPKSRRFLRLCQETLQNGPDPTNKKRSMHCGLGELYFAMTGKQPDDVNINEDDVVDLALELSTLNNDNKNQSRKQVRDAVEALDISPTVKDGILETLTDDFFEEAEYDVTKDAFCEELGFIADVNDADDNDNNSPRARDGCSYETYRSRARRVANQLRKAAKLLPS